MTDALNELTPNEIHYSNQPVEIDLVKLKTFNNYINRKTVKESNDEDLELLNTSSTPSKSQLITPVIKSVAEYQRILRS